MQTRRCWSLRTVSRSRRNKMDLVRQAPDDLSRFPETRTVCVSALEGTGLSDLEDAVLPGSAPGRGTSRNPSPQVNGRCVRLRSARMRSGSRRFLPRRVRTGSGCGTAQSARARLGEITERMSRRLLDSISGRFASQVNRRPCGQKQDMEKAIHWFRRDLRLTDNTALWNARKVSQVIRCSAGDDEFLARPDVGAPESGFCWSSQAAFRGIERSNGRLWCCAATRRRRFLRSRPK